uniref:NACHT domain-containing protein n=1 Tax=Electrophorus electricus TaxID=8005 RepID=A0A4W4H9V7_ELEEL
YASFLSKFGTYKKEKFPLNAIFTNLIITGESNKKLSSVHEVLATEKSQSSDETGIKFSEIFGDSKGEIRTVLTKGEAGIGKTVLVQKFILDWAERNAHEDVMFLFVLPFRKLNLIEDQLWSLHELLVHLHPSLKGCRSSDYFDKTILFIFDGLEECKITMDFRHASVVSDVDTKSTVDALIINLISGMLLPSAFVWITSRPAAANLIPSKYIDRMVEIQGFGDQQKEEYFRKRVGQEDQLDRIISHIKAARSLQIMCRIPVFCWISVTVLQPWLTQESEKEIPTTLTEMYSHFLLVQTNTKNEKFDDRQENDGKKLLECNRKMILKLAELAFNQLVMGNVTFCEEDLEKCGIDVTEATVNSGLCTEILKMESKFYQRKFYCFVHLSFQEFFAALYVFYCYLCKNMDRLKILLPKTSAKVSGNISLEEIMKCVVDQALESKNGRLDLFLCFLHGILLESSQRLLQGILPHIQSNSESIKKIIQNLKRGQKKHINPERWINLSHCLIEMKDNSIQQEIQSYLKSKTKSKRLSLAHCSAMANMFQASEKVMDELDLKKYNTSEEGRRRLIPAVRNCRKAILADCNLTNQSCENITSALQSRNSPLREIDLSNNDLQHSMNLLCHGLRSSHCELEIIRLTSCMVTGESCRYLANALKENSTLRELDLSCNDLQDKGMKKICSVLKSSHSNLEVLRLSDCKLTEQSCKDIASVLQNANSYLKDLDLGDNDLKDLGVELLSVGLKSSNCSLEILRQLDLCYNYAFQELKQLFSHQTCKLK